jgi:beta-glucosidase
MVALKLGEDFLLGTATSSVQIEGGDTNNTWYKWCEEGHIKDLSSTFTACDHWHRVEEDTEILKSLGVQTHRLSLEWSRIEPAPGEFSAEATNHYREELELLLANNIQPLVTLHHFSEPIWFQELGGWLKPENSEFFVEYVRYVVENLGDLVAEWVTFNEPNVFINFGYLIGIFPPGEKGLFKYFRVSAEIIKTHIRVYRLIHKIRSGQGFQGETRVGTAMHHRVFDGLTFVGKRTAELTDYFFHDLFLEGMIRGEYHFPLGLAGGKDEVGIYADFLGINYYTRNIVEFVFDPTCYFHRCRFDSNMDKSDLGWDIYPQGIYRVCKKYFAKYQLPIYITENGISDQADNKRAKFIVDHLAYLVKAIGENIPVQRYYHWSVMDNFEWLEGEAGYFGLYHCDFRTQKRTVRKSAYVYARICRDKELVLPAHF